MLFSLSLVIGSRKEKAFKRHKKDGGMADCFDDINPASCVGLGTKLKTLNVSGSISVNSCIDFDIGDWTLSGNCYYELTILSSVHDKGTCALAEIHRLVSGTLYEEVGVEKFWENDGTLRLRVVKNPDCRFIGRAIIDG